MERLSNVKVGQVYKIKKVGGDEKILRRFLELGFAIGVKIKIVSKSLQKKVCLIEIRGYLLSIRTNLLSEIYVE